MTNAPEAPTEEHSVALNEAIKAIKAGADNRLRHITEYLNVLSSGMEGLRIDPENVEGHYEDAVIASINNFIPHLLQFTELLSTITQYEATENYADIFHKFFERLIPYFYRLDGFRISYHRTEVDNFRFIIHELFLYTIAIFLKEEKFETVNHLISNKYHAEYNARQGEEPMISYVGFNLPVLSINEVKNRKLEEPRILLQADILKARTQHSGVDFKYLMQADSVLFMRAELVLPNLHTLSWWPITLSHASGAFEIFERAESIRYFDKIKHLFNITTKDDMIPLFNIYDNHEKQLPSWGFDKLDSKSLMNFDKLATTP